MKIYITIPGARYAGLMSYFVQVVENLNVIKDTPHKLYVKFDENMLYQDLRYGKNVWEYYFYQPFSFTQEEVDAAEKIGGVWLEGSMNIPSRLTKDVIIKANKLITDYIKPKEHIESKINKFIAENISEYDKVLALHKRGTDHVDDAPEVPIETYFSTVDKYIDDYQKLLLCTDEEYTVTAFKQRYGSKVIFYNSIRAEERTKIGVHQSIGLCNPYKMGEDVIVETYLMSKSNLLIKTVSNVSNASVLINKSLNYIEIDAHIIYGKYSK